MTISKMRSAASSWRQVGL